MKVAVAKLKSVSPLSMGRHFVEPDLPRELPDAKEARTWRGRIHCDESGRVFIPPMMFANSIKNAAKFMSETIKGKGKATWTKHFAAGVMVSEPTPLPIKRDDVPGEWLFVPSDGTPGGGRRVNRCFPRIESWEGEVRFYILDDTITREVFDKTLRTAGALVGIGRFRPQNRGYYGRFNVVSLDWQE